MKEVIILTGATASGKSALAIEYAIAKGGIVINADSMQMYGCAPVMTAQPSLADQQKVPHRLYGAWDADIAGSVTKWLDDVCLEIQNALKMGMTPIVTGGTGMYLDALMHGLSAIPEIDPAIRQTVRAIPLSDLYDLLKQADPVIAERLHSSDHQRIARALEVIRSTGHSLSYWHTIQPTPPMPDLCYRIHIVAQDRDMLYERINQRVHNMIHHGGIEEVSILYKRNLSRQLPLMRAVGIKELLCYFDGQINLQEAIALIQTNTRHYAKRQLTWIRHHYADATFIS